MKHYSLLDLTKSQKSAPAFNRDEIVLTDEDTPYLRENLLIETVKSAFGESRGGQKRKPSDEAWAWILSEERELPFSFDQCCFSCGVDPEKMLDSLRYYKRKFLS